MTRGLLSVLTWFVRRSVKKCARAPALRLVRKLASTWRLACSLCTFVFAKKKLPHRAPPPVQATHCLDDFCSHVPGAWVCTWGSTRGCPVCSGAPELLVCEPIADMQDQRVVLHIGVCMDTLAEWSRRRPAKPMGSPRVGLDPTGVDFNGLVPPEEDLNLHLPLVPTRRARVRGTL